MYQEVRSVSPGVSAPFYQGKKPWFVFSILVQVQMADFLKSVKVKNSPETVVLSLI